eukprot:g16126.t1
MAGLLSPSSLASQLVQGGGVADPAAVLSGPVKTQLAALLALSRPHGVYAGALLLHSLHQVAPAAALQRVPPRLLLRRLCVRLARAVRDGLSPSPRSVALLALSLREREARVHMAGARALGDAACAQVLQVMAPHLKNNDVSQALLAGSAALVGAVEDAGVSFTVRSSRTLKRQSWVHRCTALIWALGTAWLLSRLLWRLALLLAVVLQQRRRSQRQRHAEELRDQWRLRRASQRQQQQHTPARRRERRKPSEEGQQCPEAKGEAKGEAKEGEEAKDTPADEEECSICLLPLAEDSPFFDHHFTPAAGIQPRSRGLLKYLYNCLRHSAAYRFAVVCANRAMQWWLRLSGSGEGSRLTRLRAIAILVSWLLSWPLYRLWRGRHGQPDEPEAVDSSDGNDAFEAKLDAALDYDVMDGMATVAGRGQPASPWPPASAGQQQQWRWHTAIASRLAAVWHMGWASAWGPRRVAFVVGLLALLTGGLWRWWRWLRARRQQAAGLAPGQPFGSSDRTGVGLVAELPCGHEFHSACMTRWVELSPAGAEPSCPLCRRPVGQAPGAGHDDGDDGDADDTDHYGTSRPPRGSNERLTGPAARPGPDSDWSDPYWDVLLDYELTPSTDTSRPKAPWLREEKKTLPALPLPPWPPGNDLNQFWDRFVSTAGNLEQSSDGLDWWLSDLYTERHGTGSSAQDGDDHDYGSGRGGDGYGSDEESWDIAGGSSSSW